LLIAVAVLPRAALAQEAPPGDPSSTIAPVSTAPPPPPRAEDPTPIPPPGPTVSTKYVVVASLAVASAATFLVSGIFDSAADSAHDDATNLAQQKACGAGPSCSAFDAKQSDASRDRALSAVFAVVGGVSLAGAFGAWFFWPEDKKEQTPSGPGKASGANGWLAPSFGPRGGSLEAGVRF
jgi:hypothetical protein